MTRSQCDKYAISTYCKKRIALECREYKHRACLISEYYEARTVDRLTPPMSPTLAEYERINNAINMALNASVEPVLHKCMVQDVAQRRGYKYSPASAYMAEASYRLRKLKFMYHCSINLGIRENKNDIQEFEEEDC